MNFKLQVPIEKRIRRRIGNKPTVNNDKNELTQFTCWQIEKTGAVGESLLHICMLLGHFEMAKRLLKYFPTMINDIYLSEDYYGENALHMAIVAEDPLMVKFLLKNGADVHQGACGKFFCPDDQKQTQQNTLTNETPIFAVATNYVGNAYFGEFPLSFAAILNQKDSVRLLMAYEADPNKQDFNGNTVLHMLVIYDNLVSPEIKNLFMQ
jgi:transient receptor potential cation channel subfamily V protein 5